VDGVVEGRRFESRSVAGYSLHQHAQTWGECERDTVSPALVSNGSKASVWEHLSTNILIIIEQTFLKDEAH